MAVETNAIAIDKHGEHMERTISNFMKLSESNKMFIIGYMTGVQQERGKSEPRQSQSA